MDNGNDLRGSFQARLHVLINHLMQLTVSPIHLFCQRHEALKDEWSIQQYVRMIKCNVQNSILALIGKLQQVHAGKIQKAGELSPPLCQLSRISSSG
jgi:hypothetical protein